MRTTRRYTIAAACPMSGIPTLRVPRAGWRRDDPGDTGDGNTGGGGSGDDGDGQGDKDTQDGDGKPPTIKGDFDPDRAKRAIAAAREAEKKAKADAAAAKARTDAILKAAGLTADGKTDPEAALKETAAKAEAATAKARSAAIELAVYKRAGKAGGDPDALLDSRRFLSAIADLDPDSADFGDKVASAIAAAVKANPKLAAGTTSQGSRGPARQGADHSGSGGSSKQRPTSLGDAVSRALGG